LRKLMHPAWWDTKAIAAGSTTWQCIRLPAKRFARQLMAEAERLLRAAGCPKINLQVRSTNTEVIEFYKSIGYKIDDVVSMGKRLEADHPIKRNKPVRLTINCRR